MELVLFVLSVVCWGLLLLFLSSTFQWSVLRLLGVTVSTPDGVYGPSDVQVRVLTIDAEEVVQETVNHIQDDIGSVHVISEKPISIDGAEVHAVPDGFECEAIRKARAIEWARREVPCSEEFVLYIDEDTLLPELPSFPDSDIVQLSERPVQSLKWVPYLCEVFRMGIQVEQRAFSKLRYPLYAWGGGFAVRKELEDIVTWDTATVTEDTNFIWRAFRHEGVDDVDLTVLKTKVVNQSPPTIGELLNQRRRWISGAILDMGLLPLGYRLWATLRTVTWGAVVFSPLLLLPLLLGIPVYFRDVYVVLVIVQTLFVLLWLVTGVRYYREGIVTALVLLVTFPVLLVVNSMGASWAIVSPTKDFRPTKKIVPEKVEEDVEVALEEEEEVAEAELGEAADDDDEEDRDEDVEVEEEVA